MPYWTPDTLKEYADSRFLASEQAVRDALLAAEKAVNKAESLAMQRAESQNEWRNTVTDLVSLSLSRTEYTVAHNALNERIASLEKRYEKAEGISSGLAAGWTRTTSVVFVVGSFSTGIVALIGIALKWH